jgi:hypothetical protein
MSAVVNGLVTRTKTKLFSTQIPTNYQRSCGPAQSGARLNPSHSDTTTLGGRGCLALKEIRMKQTLTALIAAGTIALSLAASITEASAQRRAGAFVAGATVGVVGGVLLGTAIANAAPRTCMVEQQVWSRRYQAWVVRPVPVAC